jgi:hypothetical protein
MELTDLYRFVGSGRAGRVTSGGTSCRPSPARRTTMQPDPQPAVNEVDRIVADLRAALDAVEVAARKAKPGPWTQDGGSIYATHPTDEVVDWVYDDSWEHIALNDPPRVLALVAAHREILELHARPHDCSTLVAGDNRSPVDGEQWTYHEDRHYEDAPCPTLRSLAAAYAV